MARRAPKGVVFDKEKDKIIELGDLIGSGEYGKVYTIDNDLEKVVKIMSFRPRQNGKDTTTEKQLIEAFMNEIKIQTELGKLNIAPIVYDYQIMDGDDGYKQGIILMQKITSIYRNVYFDIGDDPSIKKKCSLPPRVVQLKLIHKIKEMINAGYIHNDLHCGNIGFIRDEVRLFDFGFTQSIQPLCRPCNNDQILGFHLYQVIEHLPFDLRDDSEYYNVIYEIRQGKQMFLAQDLGNMLLGMSLK